MNGYPTTAAERAPLDKRYIGMFYYSDYWDKWDKVIGFKGNFWIVQGIQPNDKVREHCTPLFANKFADKPFKVRPSTPI